MTNERKEKLYSDFRFALDNMAPFNYQQSPCLRYLAAINPDVTKKDFVAAGVHFDFNPKTVAIQFAQSRRFDLVTYPEEWAEIDKEGRLVAINDPT